MYTFFDSIKLILVLGLLVLSAACGFAQPPLPTATENQTTVPLPHSQPTQSQTPYESQSPVEQTPPASEPAPLRVAFIKDNNVWVWTEGQGSRQVTEAGQVVEVRLSSDGQLVGFVRQVDEFHQELWAAGVDESQGAERVVVDADAFTRMEVSNPSPFAKGILPHNIQFVPGTHKLVFNIYQTFEGPGLAEVDSLWMVDADNGDVSVLLPSPTGGVPTFSPDGKQMAISNANRISLVNVDGSNYRAGVLVFEPVMTYSEYFYVPSPVWSSDSSFLRVAIPPSEPLAQPAQATTLWRIPSDGSMAVREGSVFAQTLGGFGPHYSPDLSRILYTKEVGRPEENLRELHIAGPDGSNDQVYHTFMGIQSHGWAGSSDRFVFSQGDFREFKIAEVGGEMRPLTSDPYNIIDVSWLDENRFLYFKSVSSGWEVHLSTANGETLMAEPASGFPLSVDFVK